MKQFSITFIAPISLVTISLSQSSGTFKHPGVFSSQAELNFIKTSVAVANGSPLVAGK
jgi:hypothetical protein